MILYSHNKKRNSNYNNNCSWKENIMPEIKYEIVENLGVLSETEKGWQKELNLISWNDRPAKYDLRDWSPNHEKMGKGITLTNEEVAKLKELLSKI